MRAQDCFLASACILSRAKGVKHNLLCQKLCRIAAASGTTVWCGYGTRGEHQETLHARAVCTTGDWGTETLSLTFMGAFRPLSLASWALGLGDRTKTTYDFYFLCTVLTSNVEVSTFTFLDTPSVQVRYHFLEENPAQRFFPLPCLLCVLVTYLLLSVSCT